MDTGFNLGPIANFRSEIRGIIPRFSPMVSVFWRFREALRFLNAHKERILPLLFFVLEAVSVMLDQFGENNVRILLVAFLLSIVGCAITLYSIKVARHDQTIMENQLLVVEIVFSGIQLIVAFFHYLLTVLQVKNNYNAAPFPLAFAGISVWFAFKKGRRTDSSTPDLPNSNVSNPPDGSSPTGLPPGSTPINESESSTEVDIEINEQPITTEPEQIMTSTSQVNPPGSSTTFKKHTYAGKQIKTLTSQVNPPGSSTTVKQRKHAGKQIYITTWG